MSKPELKKDPLTALYFPLTYIREELLKPLLFFFDSLVLYQPSEWQSPLVYPELVKAGLLRLETPLPAGPELPALEQKVRQILSWGDMVFSSGQLGYLKHLRESGAKVEEYGEIMAALRGEEPAPPAFENNVATRLFLHLAQEFDRREDEMLHLHHRLSSQESKLWSELLPEGENPSPPRPIYAPEGEGAISSATRLKAWSRLFEKGFSGAETLVTANPAVMDLLPPRELILELPLPDFSSQEFTRVLELREQKTTSEALTIIKGYLRQIIKRLRESPWTADALKNAEAELKPALQILERISQLSHLPPYQLSLYLFPMVSTLGMIAKGTSNEQNGFAFLLAKGSIHENS